MYQHDYLETIIEELEFLQGYDEGGGEFEVGWHIGVPMSGVKYCLIHGDRFLGPIREVEGISIINILNKLPRLIREVKSLRSLATTCKRNGQTLLECIQELEADRVSPLPQSPHRKDESDFNDGHDHALDRLRSVLVAHGVTVSPEVEPEEYGTMDTHLGERNSNGI